MRACLGLHALWVSVLLSGCGSNSNIVGAGESVPNTGGTSGAGGTGNGPDGSSGSGARSDSGNGAMPGKDGGSGGSSSGGAGSTSEGGIPVGLSVGQKCSASAPCRPGLTCATGACAFSHSTAAGLPCAAASECKTGLQCVLGQCAPAGTGAADASCTGDSDCATGLRCGLVGFAAECVPQGSSDIGGSCGTSNDCYAGLVCGNSTGDAGSRQCLPTPKGLPTSFGIPEAPALDCEPATQGKVTAYFEVKGATGSDANGDFFRLPFPNDARIAGGKIDLSGFPTPGSSLLGFDPVKIYLDAITASESAWGTYPTILFRFSGPIDFDTFKPSGSKSPVSFIDVTDPKNPGNGGAEWAYSSAGGKYICHDWFGVRRPLGMPLDTGHTYAVYLTTDGHDANGLAIQRSPELVSLLGASAPSDAALANAYAAYAPFRSYLTAQSINPSTILNAAVFTTSNVRGTLQTLAATAKAAAAPTASNWVKCGGGAVSPCPQAQGDRACGSGTAQYDEYHALLTLPIFQNGTEPYLTSGGDIDPTAVVRTEQVCASLTVPTAKMPAAGYPLVVYAHGTGGSFRDHVRPEVAGVLASATPAMAVIGYDQVEHGTRRGASTESPDDLFFNFRNPGAARGNPIQGGADVISVGRLANTLTVPASVTGAAAIKISSATVFFGHSQGSMAGSLGLPYTNDYSAALLSGNGASLIYALLNKTEPQNIAAALPFALGGDYDGQGKLFGGEYHPVLTILDQWIGPSDPLNFAQAIARAPEPSILPKSVFQTYGLGDSYAPPVTLQIYSLAAGLALAAHDPTASPPDAIGDLQEQPVPLSGTFAANGHTVTLGAREYGPPKGDDGHFVVFDVPSANQDAVGFLSTAAAGKVPVIGQ